MNAYTTFDSLSFLILMCCCTMFFIISIFITLLYLIFNSIIKTSSIEKIFSNLKESSKKYKSQKPNSKPKVNNNSSNYKQDFIDVEVKEKNK